MNFGEYFWHEIAFPLLYMLLTVLAGTAAAQLRRMLTRSTQEETKHTVVSDSVRAAQQLYGDEDGSVRKAKAAETILRLLTEKKIPITAQELDTLIEAAVAEFKRQVGDK
ncbi:MAG: hypothetical protein IKW76_06505 [Clostridia bacterium]|nr:hypothetical protein [Clostridia bacterium]